MEEPATSEQPALSEAAVRKQASQHGYLLSQLFMTPAAGYWLTQSTNWSSYEPGRTLDEIHAFLDGLDGGRWWAANYE